MLSEQLKNYAKLLLTTGVNLQPGQPLLISADVKNQDFVTILVKEAYVAGAKDVTVNWRSQKISRERLLHAHDEALANPAEWISTFYHNQIDTNTAFISLISANPKALAGVPVERITLQSKSLNKALEFYHKAIMTSDVTWCIAAVATPLWADLLGYTGTTAEKVATLWKTIFTLVRMQEDSSVKPFAEHLLELETRRTKLTELQFAYLHYTCPNGTDLRLGLPQHHIWQGGAEPSLKGTVFTANIPTEEVYSAPQYNDVNGIVYSTKPLIYHGNTIDGFSLTFENGKVVAYHAETGEEYLKELLETDEGSSYLGEVALVDHYSPISQTNTVYFETLFDENASCHLALGAAYPTCLQNGDTYSKDELKAHGLNHSLTHVDFMIGHAEMNITGITHDNREVPVMVKGRLML